MTQPVSELFLLVTKWAGTQGAARINELPGCWHGAREHDGDRIEVTYNGHNREYEDVPPIHCKLMSTKYLAFALVGAAGGMSGGVDEDYWIKAFSPDFIPEPNPETIQRSPEHER